VRPSAPHLRVSRADSVRHGRDDPQLIINLLASFPSLTSLRLTVGPLFAPEHLDELFEAPKWQSSIQSMWLRFNPYVMERSYYTFLKVR
jgi:hypothetical protein